MISSPTTLLRPDAAALELLEEARLAALAALLVLERQVVQPVRGRLVVVRIERDASARPPTSRRPRRTDPRRAATG